MLELKHEKASILFVCNLDAFGVNAALFSSLTSLTSLSALGLKLNTTVRQQMDPADVQRASRR